MNVFRTMQQECVSPHKLSLCLLVRMLLPESDEKDASDSSDELSHWCDEGGKAHVVRSSLPPTALHQLRIFVTQEVLAVDRCARERGLWSLCEAMRRRVAAPWGGRLADALVHLLRGIASPDDVVDLFEVLSQMTDPHRSYGGGARLTGDGALSLFVRRLVLATQSLSFSSVSELFDALHVYLQQARPFEEEGGEEEKRGRVENGVAGVASSVASNVSVDNDTAGALPQGMDLATFSARGAELLSPRQLQRHLSRIAEEMGAEAKGAVGAAAVAAVEPQSGAKGGGEGADTEPVESKCGAPAPKDMARMEHELRAILHVFPDLPRAHMLRYLVALRRRDFAQALSSLLRYCDYTLRHGGPTSGGGGGGSGIAGSGSPGSSVGTGGGTGRYRGASGGAAAAAASAGAYPLVSGLDAGGVGGMRGAASSLFSFAGAAERVVRGPTSGNDDGDGNGGDDDSSAGRASGAAAAGTDDRHHMQYVALSLAALHHGFGHTEEALDALHETVRVAQQQCDHVCVAFALAWLSSALGAARETPMADQCLLRCLVRARELRLPLLHSVALLTVAGRDATALGSGRTAGDNGGVPGEVGVGVASTQQGSGWLEHETRLAAAENIAVAGSAVDAARDGELAAAGADNRLRARQLSRAHLYRAKTLAVLELPARELVVDAALRAAPVTFNATGSTDGGVGVGGSGGSGGVDSLSARRRRNNAHGGSASREDSTKGGDGMAASGGAAAQSQLSFSSQLELRARQLQQRAAVYEARGSATMARLVSRMALLRSTAGYSSRPAADALAQSHALASLARLQQCGFSTLSASQNAFERPLSALLRAQPQLLDAVTQLHRRPNRDGAAQVTASTMCHTGMEANSEARTVLRAATLRLLCEWALTRGDIGHARASSRMLCALLPCSGDAAHTAAALDARTMRASVECAAGRYGEALDQARELEVLAEQRQCHEQRARLLLLQARAVLGAARRAGGTVHGALPPLLRALQLAERAGAGTVRAEARLTLAELRLGAGAAQCACEILDDVLPYVAEHLPPAQMGSAQLLRARAELALASAASDVEPARLESASSKLRAAADAFDRAGAANTAKEVYYLQARVAHEMGNKAERDAASTRFAAANRQQHAATVPESLPALLLDALPADMRQNVLSPAEACA